MIGNYLESVEECEFYQRHKGSDVFIFRQRGILFCGNKKTCIYAGEHVYSDAVNPKVRQCILGSSAEIGKVFSHLFPKKYCLEVAL